jgi:hypothetical protein
MDAPPAKSLMQLGVVPVAAFLCCVLLLFVVYLLSSAPVEPSAQPRQVKPQFSFRDVWNVALVATYEGQDFPEPDKSRAFRAIAWTMRNRIAASNGAIASYSDEANLLSRYQSYKEHKNDLPDRRALEIAFEVLSATTNEGDATRGARHFVDNSYWTGTHEQTGAIPKVDGKWSDADVQRLVDESRFTLVIEWKSPPNHPKGPLFFGLYFFDYWPPPQLPTPTSRPTRTPTHTPTRTPTPTVTPTFTPTSTATPTITTTGVSTATPTLTRNP